MLHGGVVLYAGVLSASAAWYATVAPQQTDARNTFQTTLGLLVTVVGLWVVEAVYLAGAAATAIAAAAAGVTWPEAREVVLARMGCGRCGPSATRCGAVLCGSGADTRIPPWDDAASWDGGAGPGEGGTAWTQPLVPDAGSARLAKGLSVGLGLSGVLGPAPSLNTASRAAPHRAAAPAGDDAASPFLSRMDRAWMEGAGARAGGGRLSRIEIEREPNDPPAVRPGGARASGEAASRANWAAAPPHASPYADWMSEGEGGAAPAARATAWHAAGDSPTGGATWLWWWHVRRSAAVWMRLCHASNEAQCAVLLALCVWGAVLLKQ
jgi:hypothetical protein